MSETKISAEIAAMIKAEFDDWLFIDRHQCGILRVGKRFIHCGQKGVADRIGFVKQGKYAGLFVGIEVKAANGKQTKEQLAFQSMVESAGCFYFLVESVEQAREMIKGVLQ